MFAKKGKKERKEGRKKKILSTGAHRFSGDYERHIDLKKHTLKKKSRNKTTSPDRAGMSSTSRLGTGEILTVYHSI